MSDTARLHSVVMVPSAATHAPSERCPRHFSKESVCPPIRHRPGRSEMLLSVVEP